MLTLIKRFREAKAQKAYEVILPYFDHLWFKETYGIDGPNDRIHLYKVYNDLVRKSSCSPNPDFDEALYLAKYSDVKKNVREGLFLCGFEHYVRFGKNEGRTSLGVRAQSNNTTEEHLFDSDWYLHEYPKAAQEMVKSNLTTNEHYHSIGLKRRYSPNAWFDEEWYQAFYPDVVIGIAEGNYRSGFDHYLKYGKAEGRIPRRKAKDILESKFTGVTYPHGFERTSALESKLRPIPIQLVSNDRTRINFVLPTFDKDIMFGGYTSIIQIFKKFQQLDYDLRILVTEDRSLCKEYAFYNLKNIIGDFDEKHIKFENIAYRENRIEISAKDRFIAYSAWDALIASDLAANTDEKKFLFLIQEDERIFHHNDSTRSIIEHAYSLPHVALFNTKDLLEYFKQKGLGVFAQKQPEQAGAFSFEHVFTPIDPPAIDKLSSKTGKRLLFYARPENHAARNLFEIGFLSLKEAIKRGYFDRSWSFDGVGTLTESRSLDLGSGKILKLMPKLEGSDYGKLLANYDIGLSLMYAPHPGLVHYEMAAAGMMVVTNTYEYRDEEYFLKKSANFVPANPNIRDLSEALKIAASKSGNINARVANAYRPNRSNWDDVFSENFLKTILTALRA